MDSTASKRVPTAPPRLGASLHKFPDKCPEPSARVQELIDRQIKAEMDADRREARANARLRCRARELMEAAEAARPDQSSRNIEATKGIVTLRPISPLELGIMYKWMADDEAANAARSSKREAGEEGGDSDGEQNAPATAPPNLAVTRWWSGGAVGLQAAWEASVGWFDPIEVTNANEVSDRGQVRRPAAAGIEALQETLRVGGPTAAARQLGDAAARSAAAPGSPAAFYLDGCQGTLGSLGPHFLGAFLEGELVGFVATKLYPVDKRAAAKRSAGSEWIIDAMGTKLARRGCGVGSVLAKECLRRAKMAATSSRAKSKDAQAAKDRHGNSSGHADDGDAEGGETFAYRIDVVPSAVGFWERLGFEAEEPTGEQAYYAERGGDLPMVLFL